jgi:nucleotide-binding universal stress UspA family protein
MKTIVIATDFSENSKHAAHYAYKLACATKANITLFNAMIVPAEIPQAGLLAWPDTEYDDLMEDSKKELEKLKSHLQTRAAATGFEPAITCFNDAGIVSDVLNRFTDHNQTELTVIGAHGANGVNEFIIGNHARHLIDHSKKPLLMIPVQASYKPIKKIAYATDFKNIDDDL